MDWTIVSNNILSPETREQRTWQSSLPIDTLYCLKSKLLREPQVMLLGLIFLVVIGGGALALDARYPEGLEPKS